MDKTHYLIASGGTAGYVGISLKEDSEYALEYIHAWLSHPWTDWYLQSIGSDFEGGFTARGTFVLSTLPFVELVFDIPGQKEIHDRVVATSREVYKINNELAGSPAKRIASQLQRQKENLITEIQDLIAKVYRLEF